MSQPARACAKPCSTRTLNGRVVDDFAALDHSVVSVIGERIEGDVTHDADLRGDILHGPDSPRYQTIGVGSQ